MESQAQPRYLLEVALLLLLIQCALAQRVSLNSRSEWTALLNLRSSLGLRGRDWPIKANPCSDWIGVHCQSGLVVEITVSGLRRTRNGRRNPRFAVDALANLTSLVKFNASGFLLPGAIPDWFGWSLVALQVLDLRSSSIIGPIPSSLGSLSNLNALYLSGNSLTGIIPSALGRLSELSILDLSRNFFTGSIPTTLSSLSKLTRLGLASNFLSGPIPPDLGSVHKLQVLNLSDNSLTSSIPVQLGNLSQLLELDLSKNSLSGTLPVDLRGLRSLNTMYIGDNGLEGPLPFDLFPSLAQLQVLVLRGNKLDSGLPRDLFSLPKLRFLDVSNNNFTGSLPSFVPVTNATGAVLNFSNNVLYGNLNLPFKFHGSLDLSGNYFQGYVESQMNATLSRNCLHTVPDQRDSYDCSLFYSERNSTFYGFGRTREQTGSSPIKNNRLKFIMVAIFGGFGFVILLALVIVVLLKFYDKDNANRRGKSNAGPVSDGNSPSLQKDPTQFAGLGDSFTYEQILHSTGNFSETNLIKHGHSGDLYKGFLKGGLPVVIKKVNLHYLKNETYSLELDFFRKVSHTRFVPFLGHCFEHETEKFFVYKYMPNGDLANCLHKVSTLEDNKQSMDWIIRLKIAMGAAEALSHLHHECNPPVIHRDVRSSSILLDDKFEVRLGSLTEACVLEGDYHQSALKRLLRKPQNSEQGSSGSSPASCSHDVYCFGKVLLELVIGKLDINETEDSMTREGLEHILHCINIHDKELITKIVDPSLMIDDDLLEEVRAMAIIAKSCLNPKPSRRPPMRHVLKALENPLKVVREDSSSSGRLRTASSRRSWSAVFHGSWRHSSSDIATGSGNVNKEGIGGSKQLGKISSHGSCGYDFSSSTKRLSNEIFPEPGEIRDIERQD